MDWGATMPQAGSDAVFDFLRVCAHDVLFNFGVRPPIPSQPQDPRPERLRALYIRIQVASPPPPRVGAFPWEFGIRISDDHEEEGRPFDPAAADPSWKQKGVFQVKGIPSLDQPDPGDILVDKWLTVCSAKDDPTTVKFNDDVDKRGFLSAWYPQPDLDESGEADVEVDYYGNYHIPWPKTLPLNSWLAISFDRFSPPERESVEYIAQVGDCDPPHD
jgi:hypothetical protein